MDEYQNVFDRRRARAQTATLASDRMNKFDKHVALQKKQRVASDTQSDRIARNESQRQGWVGPNRSDVRGTTGVKLTEELASLKAASDASRMATKASLPDPEEMADVATAFRLSTPEFRPTAFNSTNLFNCAMAAVAAGKITWSIRGLREVSQWLEKNGYYEGRPGDPTRSAPKIFAEYVDAERQALEAQKQAFAAALVDQADRKRAEAMTFEELQQQVRGENKKFATRQDY